MEPEQPHRPHLPQHPQRPDANCPTPSTEELIRELQSQVALAKAQILDTLLTIDHITLQENPQIEADYVVKIGYLANDLAKAELAARRAKRKLALAQAAANREQTLNNAELETALDREFDEWMRQVEQAVAHAFKLIEWRAGAKIMGAAEEKRLKTLYRNLAKRLHPDINPGQSPKDERLFVVVQLAYGAGDLETLEALAHTLGAEGLVDERLETVAELSAELLFLETQLKVHEERLREVRESFPYNMREFLEDPVWVAETAADLREQIALHRRAEEQYLARIKELMGDE